METIWETLPLQEVATINPRRPRVLNDLPDSKQVTFVPMAAVDERLGAITDSEVKPFNEVRKGFTYFEDDDVLFAKITPCMQNGKSVVARGLVGGLGFGSTEFHVLRAGERVRPEWLHRFVRQLSFREAAMRHFRGSAGQQRVPKDFLETHPIPIPPLEEQDRVLGLVDECLERLLEANELRKDALRDAEALEAAVFADFLEDREEHLEVVPLGDLLEGSKYGTSKKANTDGRGYPCLRMGNIQDGQLDVADLKHVELSGKEASKVILREGDLVINRTNSLEQVGKSAVFTGLDGDWVYASYLVRLRPNPERVLPAFLNAVINSRIGRSYVYKTARRAIGMVNVNATEIKALPVPVPSLEEQAVIVGQMGQARRAATDLLENMATDELDALTGAVLRKAFAGEL